MRTPTQAFLERVEQCNSLEELDAAVANLRHVFEVEHAVYHSVNNSGEQYALNTYSGDWGDYYETEALYRIDPVVLSAFQKFHAYDWKSLDWQSKQARRFFGEAQDGGVGNQGVSVPIRGPHGEFALFSLSHKCPDTAWAKFLTTYKSDLLLIAHFLHMAVRNLENRDAHLDYVTLSPRETESLQLLGGGLNRAAVADRLNISEHTVRVYVESARFKLGAANTTHAVAKAMSHGLIAL